MSFDPRNVGKPRISTMSLIVTGTPSIALSGAPCRQRCSEARWNSGYARGLLDGVPISIKDIFLTEGWPTRRGSTSVDPGEQRLGRLDRR